MSLYLSSFFDIFFYYKECIAYVNDITNSYNFRLNAILHSIIQTTNINGYVRHSIYFNLEFDNKNKKCLEYVECPSAELLKKKSIFFSLNQKQIIEALFDKEVFMSTVLTAIEFFFCCFCYLFDSYCSRKSNNKAQIR